MRTVAAIALYCLDFVAAPMAAVELRRAARWNESELRTRLGGLARDMGQAILVNIAQNQTLTDLSRTFKAHTHGLAGAGTLPPGVLPAETGGPVQGSGASAAAQFLENLKNQEQKAKEEMEQADRHQEELLALLKAMLASRSAAAGSVTLGNCPGPDLAPP